MKYKSLNTKSYNINWNETNYNPGLVACYDIRPGNEVGLFSQEKIKEK